MSVELMDNKAVGRLGELLVEQKLLEQGDLLDAAWPGCQGPVNLESYDGEPYYPSHSAGGAHEQRGITCRGGGPAKKQPPLNPPLRNRRTREFLAG